jgi:prepilin-type N-terminal cleavage/methylation domain-containing protein
MKIKMNIKKGFTLLESMIVVSILGILLSASIPFYLSLTNDSDVENLSRDMLRMLSSSRQNAIKEGLSVYVYPSSLDINWENDWIKYVNGNTTNYIYNNRVSVDNESNISSIRFDSRGRVYSGITSNVLNNASFLFCHKNDSTISGRRITINGLGRLEIERVDEC